MTLVLAPRADPKQPEVNSEHRVVGIIGGMGPEATVDLMRRVVAKTPAHEDQDHVHLIVESNPKIPSRIAHLIEGTGADPTPELIRIAANLQRAGAQALAIPCNTAHAYAHSIRRAVSIPLLDMIDLTVKQIAGSPRIARVGLLASSAVIATELYAKAFSGHGIAVVRPGRQDEVMALIRAVKRGDTGLQIQTALGHIALELSSQADVLLIGCSELSVIAAGVTVPFVDSLEVQAEAIVKFATSAA
ncbi:MAG TPA: amino acid racemase [Steroidobacteraceae bacterium]|jgi:aspartate racemase|nr:amino acid racemase [Steroidobacteraceae bacterium]